MKGNVTRRSRIAALAFALIFMISSMATVVVSIAPAGATLPARTQTTTSNFTYNGVSGNFSVSADPVYYGASSGYITTDWGAAGVHSGMWSIIGIKRAAIDVMGTWYDVKMNYWYYNGTGISGRPFNGHWSDWYQLQDDSYASVYERYAQAPSAYTGSGDEWNITVRIAILQEDPVIICDAWLRFCNTTTLIKNFDLNPVYYEPPAWTGITHSTDAAHSMSYMVQDAGNWAVGVIGASPDTTNNAATAADYNMVNRTAKRLTESTHARVIMVVGQDLATIQETAEDVGSTWAAYQEKSNHHLVIAKNGNSFDCLSYFPDDGYIIYPSGTSETIIEDGVERNVALGQNRILDYQKIPIIMTIDEMQYARGSGEDADMDWLYGIAERYQIPVTLPSYFGGTIFADDFNSYVNLSLERNGSLFEIADHSNNHTNYYGNQAYATPYNGWLDSKADWAIYTDTPLLSEGLGNNAWSYNTWDALGAAGCKNIRLSQQPAGWIAPRDYNLTGSPVWVASFQILHLVSPADEGTLDMAHMNGYYAYEGHVAQFDDSGEKAALITYWSWLQNQTTLQAMTWSAWSDIWHHRLAYSEIDGKAVIDLTTAQTNHYVTLSNNAAGESPLLWDMTANSAARTASGNSTSITVVLTAGHVYREMASVKITGAITYRLTSFDLDGSALAQVSVNGTNGSAMDFVFGGLTPGDVYNVYVDGLIDATDNMVSSAGYTSYTYDGPWSSHVIEWTQGQSAADILNSFMPLIVLAIILSLVGVVIGGTGSKKR